MNLTQMLEKLKNNPFFMENVTAWRTVPPREAKYAPWPEGVDPRLPAALGKHGVHQLYTHQAECFAASQAGKDYVVVTPTASGKTLCYNLPVLAEILRNPDARALYLFPTKALSADQVAELYELIELLGADVKTFTYDGDTPAAARRAVRQAGHVVVTNPDMLHSGILPQHTKWVKLFENLKYIVVDEIHTYRGVFGSNLANVLRRLLRLCEFYGSHPQFILCSATIQNPKELAETLIGRPVTLIDNNGAPAGEKHYIFYNPPVVNRQLGIRKGVLPETRAIASMLVKNGVQSIVFAKSRLQVEVLTRQLKELVSDPIGNSGKVRGYRGGYLPSERREIERGLRAGDIQAVVSTNALELGIDIGALEACVLCGYPGTIASTWQQSGRAGRRHGVSATFMVASSNALDQFIVTHPDYFFTQPAENALLNPDNLYILLSHFKCAAYELPFKAGETLGNAAGGAEMLEYLEESNIFEYCMNGEVTVSGLIINYTVFMTFGELTCMIFGGVSPVFTKWVGSKRMAFIWAGVICVATSVLYFFIPMDPNYIWMMVVVVILTSIGIGIYSPLLWSMYADVSDYATEKNGTSSTGLIFSSGTMAMKFGTAISGSLVALLLGMAGFISGTDATGQTIITITDIDSVQRMIWALFSVFPAIIAAIMIGLLYIYPIKK